MIEGFTVAKIGAVLGLLGMLGNYSYDAYTFLSENIPTKEYVNYKVDKINITLNSIRLHQVDNKLEKMDKIGFDKLGKKEQRRYKNLEKLQAKLTASGEDLLGA